MALNGWIRTPQPNPQARLRLFCFPYAGGGASLFRTWPAALPRDIEVCAIQLPGREDRLSEAPFDRLSSLIQALSPVLLPVLDKPFALFGHSMGAVISYELARHLERKYQLTPTHLFVAGRQAPQMPELDAPLYHLPPARFLEEVRQRYQRIPEEVWRHPELIDLLLPLLRGDFSLVQTVTYVADEPLGCPISAFGGLQDSSVSYQELAAWREQTRNYFRLRMIPGDHFFLTQSTDLLLAAIAHDLAPARHSASA